ncbi:MAG: TIGR04053 family radical SAM/SPASM domain-containing protein [Nitriliruptor sp.]|nr:MAG: TIGR04053 family radical SAM/SPASM domain-containing protein [Nitriliruptor sp.]
MNGHGRTAIRKVHQDVHQRPFLVIWESTRACQLVCQHCRADSQNEPHPLQLSTEEGKRLLDDIASFGVPSPMVVISGGDPFEREDLTELIAYGKQAGLSMALAPSVTPKATRERFAAAAAAGAKAVSISLDGATAPTHDGFRGIEGVYDATLPVCRDIIDLGMRLQINTTVTAGNVGELPELLRQVIDLDAFLWSVFLLVPTGRGEALQALPPEEVEDVLHWLVDVSNYLAVKTTEAPHFRRVILQRRRAGEVDAATSFGLGDTYRRLRAALDDILAERDLPTRVPRPPLDINAGRGFVFIDHIGNVHPSGFLPVPGGSLRERSLPEIYREAPLFRELRDVSLLGGRCGRCEYRNVCGGSRSRAYAVTGDHLAEEPYCAYEPRGGPMLDAAGAPV